MPPPTYLDNAATTPMLPEIADTMRAIQVEDFGNPSSPHGFGDRPRRLLDDAREFLRGTFCAARVVLTSGGSEADLVGVAGAALAREPGRVLAGAADHPAVLAQSPLLERLGHTLEIVPTGPFGVLEPDQLEARLGPDVRAVAILHGHNELGSLARLDELVPLIRARAPDAHVHVDLVQAYGKIAFDLDREGVDSAAISAHKFHGPRGVGCLALSSTARVVPLQPAGGQEHGMRGGTENVAGVCAMARAAEIVLSDLAAQRAHADELAAVLLDAIRAELPAVTRLGDPVRRLPHIVSLRIPGIRGQTLQEMLAASGVAFSTGSACHAGEEERENHVLRAVGLDRAAAREVIRISFSRLNTRDEVTRAARLVVDAARELAARAPARGRGR